MREHALPLAAALAVVGTFSAVVYAQSADRSIQYRRAIMSAQGWHMYTVLGQMAKGTRSTRLAACHSSSARTRPPCSSRRLRT